MRIFGWEVVGLESLGVGKYGGLGVMFQSTPARHYGFFEKVNLVASSDIARLFLPPLLLKAKSRQKPVAVIQASNWLVFVEKLCFRFSLIF